MAQCIFCGAETSFLSQKKIINGVMCGKCAVKVPRVLHASLSSCEKNEIQAMMDYKKEMEKREFSATASYGKLHIDEMNGLIAVCDKVDDKGNPVGNADIFDCVYLEGIWLYPINPRQSNKDIVCDVEFNFSYLHPKMKFKLTVRQSVKCEYKKLNKTQVTWSEPGELSMFRNMLDQTIKASVKKEMEARSPNLTPYGLDLMKARVCLHVYEGCPEEMIHRHYKDLKRMYEESGYEEKETENCTYALNYYYNLLIHASKKNISREQSG